MDYNVNVYLSFEVVWKFLAIALKFVQFLAWKHDSNDIGQKNLLKICRSYTSVDLKSVSDAPNDFAAKNLSPPPARSLPP